MRIIGRLNVGGPARQACFLHESLRPFFDTVLITGRVDEGEADMSYLLSSDASVYTIGSMSRPVRAWTDLVAFWRIFRILKHERPTVVHTHTAKAGALGRAAAVLARVPVRVHSFHGHVFQGYFGPKQVRIWIALERVLSRFTTRIIAVSPAVADALSGVYRIAPASRIRIIRTGFDLAPFVETQARQQIRREFAVADDEFLVLWAGRMVPVKNVHLLAEVIRAAADVPRMKFVIVGDGSERNLLRDATAGYDNVCFAGWRADMAQLWTAADAGLLTSINEGTPTALVEAMAAGKPFVATPVGGVLDLTVPPLEKTGCGTRAANGFLTAADAAEILECLRCLLQNQELARRMGRVGREFVLANYTQDRLVRDIQELYQELISAAAPPT